MEKLVVNSSNRLILLVQKQTHVSSALLGENVGKGSTLLQVSKQFVLAAASPCWAPLAAPALLIAQRFPASRLLH